MVLVDSCCWIEALRKDGRIEVKAALQELLGEFEALLRGPVELEVLGGSRANELQSIQSYFDIPPTEQATTKYGVKPYASTGYFVMPESQHHGTIPSSPPSPANLTTEFIVSTNTSR